MITAVWMVCVLISGLIAAVVGVAALFTVGPRLDRWFRNRLDG